MYSLVGNVRTFGNFNSSEAEVKQKKFEIVEQFFTSLDAEFSTFCHIATLKFSDTESNRTRSVVFSTEASSHQSLIPFSQPQLSEQQSDTSIKGNPLSVCNCLTRPDVSLTQEMVSIVTKCSRKHTSQFNTRTNHDDYTS